MYVNEYHHLTSDQEALELLRISRDLVASGQDEHLDRILSTYKKIAELFVRTSWNMRRDPNDQTTFEEEPIARTQTEQEDPLPS